MSVPTYKISDAPLHGWSTVMPDSEAVYQAQTESQLRNDRRGGMAWLGDLARMCAFQWLYSQGAAHLESVSEGRDRFLPDLAIAPGRTINVCAFYSAGAYFPGMDYAVTRRTIERDCADELLCLVYEAMAGHMVVVGGCTRLWMLETGRRYRRGDLLPNHEPCRFDQYRVKARQLDPPRVWLGEPGLVPQAVLHPYSPEDINDEPFAEY